jgi:ATP-dependent Lon protease
MIEDSILRFLSEKEKKWICTSDLSEKDFFSRRNLPFKLVDKVDHLPTVISHGVVLFPSNKIPINFLNHLSEEDLLKAERGSLRICILPTAIQTKVAASARGRQSSLIDPSFSEEKSSFNRFGTEAILGIVSSPEGGQMAVVKGMRRILVGEVEEIDKRLLTSGYIIEDKGRWSTNKQIIGVNNLRRDMLSYLQYTSYVWSDFPTLYMCEDAMTICHALAQHLPMTYQERLALFSVFHPAIRVKLIRFVLERELELVSISQSIHEEVRQHIQHHSRAAFLKEQLKIIKKELGESQDQESQDYDFFEETFKTMPLSQEARKSVEREMARFKLTPGSSPEYTQIWTYLNWIKDIPWSETKSLNLKISDLEDTQRFLDQEYYGMAKVKKRILEHVALLIHRKEHKGDILLLDGPPGIGKTSLVGTIAKALNLPFAKISLGGLRDEAEIRGHRRTYVGALPGKIIQALRQAKGNPCVILLDEIDKVGSSQQGDPSSALLEVLDPEQNQNFTDHFLGFSYDLSSVLFIATSNNYKEISPPLLDRMEVISMSGYTEEEKIHIGRCHLIPKISKDLNLPGISLSPEGVKWLIRSYTREAGVRDLKRNLESLGRGQVFETVKYNQTQPFSTEQESLLFYLGTPKYLSDAESCEELSPGVSRGLAYTAFGGDILYIESRLHALPGSKMERGSLTLTGRLGKVMEESAYTALSYLRSEGSRFDLDPKALYSSFIHLHFPDGATPKDGPSAGLAILTSLASLIQKKSLPPGFAMTGEITLRGEVLPVGGIKEKLLAAHRQGIFNIIIPSKNWLDLDELDGKIRKDFNIYPVKKMEDVLYLTNLVEKPLDFVDLKAPTYTKKIRPLDAMYMDQVNDRSF